MTSPLPIGWTEARLGDISKIKTGTRNNQDKTDFGRYPFFVRSACVERIDSFSYDCEAILVPGEGEIGSIFHYITGKFEVHQRVYKISDFANYVSGKFIYYYMSEFFGNHARRNSLKATVDSLRLPTFQNFVIKLPTDVREQQRIVEALENADQLIASLERLITKKQAIKQGMMQELLTGRTRLPGFSDSWRTVRLGDHVRYVKTVPLSRDQLDRESPLRYLHYGDIHTRASVFLDAAQEPMPRASATLASRAGQLKVGDLVFADASEDAAGVGKSVEITDVPTAGVVAGLHTIAARFDKSVVADGYKAHLQFIPSFRQSLLRLAAGTKVLATTRSYISSIDVQLPAIDEQHAIACTLADCERELVALHARLNKARDVKEGMMQELLTGRTRLPVEEAVA